jgi:hypothetical protein
MRTLAPLLALLATLLMAGPALAEPCDAPGLRNTPGAYENCVREWYGRSNASGTSAADRNFRQYLQNQQREMEEDRERRAESARQAARNPRPVAPRTEYDGERKLREEEKRYREYRSAELQRVAQLFKRLNHDFEKPAMGADGYTFAVGMNVPFAGEMLAWAEKGYQKYPVGLSSLLGFLVAADPCADNPNQVGFPLSSGLDMGNTFYAHLNRHPECTYGRMYRALPHLLAAQKSDFPPFRALACAQIDAWIARHFNNGVPVHEPVFFQGPVYNAGDYRYLTEKLAQCRAGLPHAAGFDQGLVQPARAWVQRTRNYFADVRLVRFYDRRVWEKVRNFDDPVQVRSVFDEVIKDFNTTTLAHPTIFLRGVDAAGNAWHAYR